MSEARKAVLRTLNEVCDGAKLQLGAYRGRVDEGGYGDMAAQEVAIDLLRQLATDLITGASSLGPLGFALKTMEQAGGMPWAGDE